MICEASMATEDLCRSCCAQKYATTFAYTSLDPLVSEESLSELELHQISNDLLLRHDLNFDHNISYRPNTHGLQGQQRTTKTIEYWHAIRTELDSWLSNNHASSTSQRSRTTVLTAQVCSSYELALPRLSRVFGAVQKILKKLVHEDEWVAIDARLDVELLMQQLKAGAFDLIALSDWLAVLLRRFSSASRHPLVDLMTSSIRLGVERADAQVITSGLIYVFDIFETMKLDAANYQIKALRSLMVDGTVAFEQRDLLSRMDNGWDPSEAHTWLANKRQSRGLSSGASTIIPAVTSTIVNDDNYLPPTFTLDYTRLRSLQTQFQNLLYRTACIRTFEAILKMLGCNETIPEPFNIDLFACISTLTSDHHDSSQQTADIALELVRRANKVCKIPSPPSSSDIDFAERHLQETYERKNDILNDLERSLGDKLIYLTEQQVDTIGNFSPVQIMNHYQLHTSAKPITHQLELLQIAQKIAHITVLHWRVWAPLIYDEPVGKRFRDSNPAAAASVSLGELQVQCSQDHEQYSRQSCRRDGASDLSGG